MKRFSTLVMSLALLIGCGLPEQEYDRASSTDHQPTELSRKLVNGAMAPEPSNEGNHSGIALNNASPSAKADVRETTGQVPRGLKSQPADSDTWRGLCCHFNCTDGHHYNSATPTYGNCVEWSAYSCQRWHGSYVVPNSQTWDECY